MELASPSFIETAASSSSLSPNTETRNEKTHVSDILEDVPAAKVVDLQHQIVDSNLHPINNECESLKNTSDNNSHSGEFTNQYGSEVQKIQENLSSQKIVNVSLCSRIVIVLRRIHI